jgi:hypothetical protein
MISQEKLTTIATAAIEAGIKPASLGDLMLAAEATDLKPGTFTDWLTQQRTDHPTWFNDQAKPETPPSPTTPTAPTENPWSYNDWNLTKQGAFVKQHGMEKASQMAKQACTTVGGLKPSKAPTAQDAPTTPTTPMRDPAGRFLPKEGEEPNPFAPETWNLTKQGQLYKADPTRAKKLAAAAGVTIGSTRPAQTAR